MSDSSQERSIPPEEKTERVEHTRPVLQPPPVRKTPGPPAKSVPGQKSALGQARPAPSKSAGQRRRPSTSRRGHKPPETIPPPATYSVAAQQPPPPRRSRPLPRHERGLYLPWWSLVIMVLVVGIVALGMVFVFAEWSVPQTPGNQDSQVQVITSQPTLSQDFVAGDNAAAQPDLWPTAISPVQPTATVLLPSPIPSPSLPPGEFVIGVRVQVVGVDINGLNVRSSPGYAGVPRFLAREDEMFVIVDGPQNMDDLVWWRVEDPNDAARTGWAARNFLMVVGP